MARRDESILNLLTVVPWWVSVVLSATVYLTLRYILPRIELGTGISASALKGFVSFGQNLAPVIALVLLVPAPIAAYNAWRVKRRGQVLNFGIAIPLGGHDPRLEWKRGVCKICEFGQERNLTP